MITSGLRGFIFSMTSTNLIQRLRNKFFAAVLKQDIEFFDQNKTGEITSRLSSDITTVGEAISINLNIFLRSIVQTGRCVCWKFFSFMHNSFSGNGCNDASFIMEFISLGDDHWSINMRHSQAIRRLHRCKILT